MVLLAILGACLFKVYRHQQALAVRAAAVASKKKKMALALSPTKSRTPFTYQVLRHDTSVHGYLLLAPQDLWDSGRICIMDLDGQLLYERLTDGVVYLFRQWRIDGRTYYCYGVNEPKFKRNFKLTTGPIVVLDSALNEIKRIHGLPYKGVVNNDRQDLDIHDFIMLSESHFITLCAYEKKVKNIPRRLKPAANVTVVADLIQETINNKVVWQWDATDFPELYKTSVEKGNFADTLLSQDYLHINSMTLDPQDSNLICSFRHASMVVKISRKTGKIIWKLGGAASDFRLAKGQRFIKQHHVTLTQDHLLLMVDNGDSLIRKSTRIIEMRLDEKAKRINTFRTVYVPDTFCHSMGSAFKSGSNYLICGGTACFVKEVDTKTGKLLFDMRTNQQCFRAYKVNDIRGLKAIVAEHQ